MRERSTTCNSCCDRSGTNNGNWRDGTTRHKAGYVQRNIPGRGYVFEHILVMEDHIGRRLVPGETVHHIFGVKDDNVIERLELWSKPQPTGIRALDALRWAREIIDRYEPIEEVLMATGSTHSP